MVYGAWVGYHSRECVNITELADFKDSTGTSLNIARRLRMDPSYQFD